MVLQSHKLFCKSYPGNFMFELSNEGILMTSNEKSVVLTTHRIIHYTEEGKKQIMLEDFENYEFKTFYAGNYIVPAILSGAIYGLLIISSTIQFFRFRHVMDISFLEYVLSGTDIRISLFFFTIYFLLHIISRRSFVRINGKYTSIEIRVKNPANASVLRFLNAIVEESAKHKMQQPGERSRTV